MTAYLWLLPIGFALGVAYCVVLDRIAIKWKRRR